MASVLENLETGCKPWIRLVTALNEVASGNGLLAFVP